MYLREAMKIHNFLHRCC